MVQGQQQHAVHECEDDTYMENRATCTVVLATDNAGGEGGQGTCRAGPQEF